MMMTLLKFRYFLLFLFLISCNTTSKEKSSEEIVTETNTDTPDTASNTNKVILFFGDSLTAGFGLEDVNDAFPSIIQKKLDSLELPYTVVNSGISGETTSGGRSRLNWVLSQKVDVFVLELGANDGLRGVPLTETRENLQVIIDAVKEKNQDVQIVLAGMQIPPNMGQTYTSEFRTIFPDLAAKNKLPLIPFLLKDVGGIAELNQADGIHPTVAGHKILADNVWEVLKEVVRSKP